MTWYVVMVLIAYSLQLYTSNFSLDTTQRNTNFPVIPSEAENCLSSSDE